HGIEVKELGPCVARLVAALAQCDPQTLTVGTDAAPSESLMLNFGQLTIGDSRFRAVGASIFGGAVRVSLFGSQDKALPPGKVGTDWTAFRKEVINLLRLLHPPGTRVTVSAARLGRSNRLGEWNYQLSYSLK